MKRYIVAMTGASGAAVGLRVLGEVLKSFEVHLIITPPASIILRDEAAIDLPAGDAPLAEERARAHFGTSGLHVHAYDDMAAPLSSGSFRTEGMLVAPCSMKTLAAIANGYSESLVERAADVTIKEGRRLLLCPRETPFSAIHLENMLRLARLGVVIAPPVAAFYHRPASIGDLVDFMAGKVLDSMGVAHSLFERWGGGDAPPPSQPPA